MKREKNRRVAAPRGAAVYWKWLSAMIVAALLAALVAVLIKSVDVEGVPKDIFVPLGAEQLSVSGARTK